MMTRPAETITMELRSASLLLPNAASELLRDELNDIAMTAINIYELAMRELVKRSDAVVHS